MNEQSGVLLFGGAFNPPHRTHRKILLAAMAAVPCRRVFVLPAGRHPHKRDRDMAPDRDRLALCEAAFGDIPGVRIDALELEREGLAYTVDTAAEFARRFPGEVLYLLVGSDNVSILDTWHEHHRLLRMVTVVTYPRRAHPVDRDRLGELDLTAAEIDRILAFVLDVEADDVSASAIRAALRRGERPPELSDPVAESIRARGLYTG